MANRNSRIVVPVFAPSFGGGYWGRYPNGDRPNAGADLAAAATDSAAMAAAASTAIKLGAGAQDAAAAGGGVSTAIKIGAGAAGVVSAGAGFAGVFDYYIATNGLDTNAGTQAAPWAITALNTKRGTYARKRVGLLDGDYNIYALLSANTDQDQYALDVAGGIAGSPTVIAAVNPRGATISAKNGSTYGSFQGTPMIGHSGNFGRGYVEFRGLRITGTKRHGIRFGIYSIGPRMQGIVVRDNEFFDFDGRAGPSGNNYAQVEYNQCDGFEHANNYHHDNIGITAGSADHFSSIMVWQSINGIVENNTSIRSGALYGKEDSIHGTKLRRNYVDTTHLSDSSAIQDFSGAEATGASTTDISNNIAIGKSGGLDLRSNLTSGWQDVLTVTNNTVIVNGNFAQPNGIILRANAGKAFVNGNIVYFNTTGIEPNLVNTYPAGIGRWNRNCYYSPTNVYQCGQFPSPTSTSRGGNLTYAQWKALTGADTNSLQGAGANPQFLGAVAGPQFYKLGPTSPCINAGTSDGSSSGTPCDMGAWMVADGSVPDHIGCDFAVYS